MRITLVGPAYPWRGGLPLLVTDLAHRLTADGHAVALQTWTRQGPARLLPTRPLAAPEAAVFPRERAPLSWWNLLDGRRVGSRAAAADLVVLVHYTTLQAPVLTAVARAARRPRCGSPRSPAAASTRGTRVVAICANAAPHEPRRGDRLLTRLLLRAVDAAVVHTGAERAALAALTGRPVAVAALPPHLPDGVPLARPTGVRRRLLFFGKVRRYKGVDVLLRALAQLREGGLGDVHLTIAGEVYPDAADVDALVGRLGLRHRVVLHPQYLSADRIPELFASVDALVLPYRSATASQHVALAHRHGVPVVATRVGNFPDGVVDGVDGLLCAPDDVDDLARALRALYAPGRLPTLRAAVRAPDGELAWKAYVHTLLTVALPHRMSGKPPSGRQAP